MRNKIILFVSLLWCIYSNAQIVINEIDPDTNSTDVKEFIELKSIQPNFPLDGYVIVFFSAGSSSPYNGISSYYAIDLDGLITDGNGIILLGNPQVTPSASYIIPQNTIQNGPDAVAIYLGNSTDFPNNTSAIATNLIDALVYSNNSTNTASALMSILGETVSYNENSNGLASTQSIQRKSDGTYEVKAPTPRANNDGSGIIYNGISISYTSSSITEGQNFVITFTTDTPVQSALNLSMTLNNSSFNSNDYTGNLNVTIPIGSNSISTSIQILNDGNNEGDENMKISIGSVPIDYILLNNNIIIRVNDINFVVQPWGTPVRPTYGLCPRVIPSGYYSTLEGKAGNNLRQAIQDIIANPNMVRVHNYGDVYNVLKEADQNPENSNQVWMIYNEQSISKIDYQTDNSIIGKWNREHIYSQSRLGLPSTFIPNGTPDGINVWRLTTGSNDIEASHDDLHHLRAVGGQENSTRNNRNYGVDYNGPAGNLGSWRGDVARAIFYMAIRYNSLNVVNGDPASSPTGQIGDLATLLTWNNLDPVDDFEMNRNNIIYNWQMNRNPFIDNPALVNYVFGNLTNSIWNSALSTVNFNQKSPTIFPNPAQNQVVISGIEKLSNLVIYSISGEKVASYLVSNESQLDLNLPSGIYLVKIISDTFSTTKKLIIN
ncbi:MAG: T9SS C-terminal target domain-containing protein [Flavobacteriaceae bacterium]|nr:T9SS C-terminal target domain-containing protein [Flavobacteriaceae bacterium]